MLFLVLMPALRLSHSGTVFTLGTAGSPWLWLWGGGTGPAATQGAAEEAVELLSEDECLKNKQDKIRSVLSLCFLFHLDRKVFCDDAKWCCCLFPLVVGGGGGSGMLLVA